MHRFKVLQGPLISLWQSNQNMENISSSYFIILDVFESLFASLSNSHPLTKNVALWERPNTVYCFTQGWFLLHLWFHANLTLKAFTNVTSHGIQWLHSVGVINSTMKDVANQMKVFVKAKCLSFKLNNFMLT